MAKQKPKTKEGKAGVSAVQLQTLKKWNLWLALLFVLQAVAIVVIGTSKTVTLTTQYPAIDPLASQATGSEVIATATRTIWDVRIACLVAVFLVIFAAVYLVVATWQRNRYETRLKVGMNDARWLGLGLGGGAALMTVGMLSGITSKASLFMLFMLMLLGCLTVLCAEEVARREGQKQAMLSHVMCTIGTLAVLSPLVVLAITVGSALLYDGTVTGWMYGIYASMLVFFVAGFLMTHYRVSRKGKWADTFYTERAYMLLVLVAASALAWQIFAGALQP